jgi:hypothetical protein
MILTAEAGHRLAVEAFNAGLIDKFLQKGDVDLPTLLIQDVKELQQKYFTKLSQKALNEDLMYLSDPVFIDFFNQLIANQKIVEYYLLDEYGSFLFLDAQAKPSWLIVKSAQDMQEFYEFATYQDAPLEILEIFKNKNMVPYFHSDEDLKTSFDHCRPFLHPALALNGKQTYYYSYVTDPNAYQLALDKIVSYEQYMSQN